MLTDILGRTAPTFGGAFSADAAVMAFSGIGLAGGVGLITRKLEFSYRQAIQRIYEVGTAFTYYIAGRAQGSVTMSRVLGPRPLLFTFYSIYGNVCNAGINTLSFAMQQGCISPFDAQAAATFRYMYMVGCVIEALGFAVEAEQMMVSEQTNMLYVALVPEQGAP
jgi:hypothetical protein